MRFIQEKYFNTSLRVLKLGSCGCAKQSSLEIASIFPLSTQVLAMTAITLCYTS